MARTGRTGADAVFQLFKHICRVLLRYDAKFRAAVTAAEGAGAISPAEATTILAFLGTASAVCIALEHLSEYTGF